MRIELIQQKVPIGSQVTFTLKTGEKFSGSLAELGRDYIALGTSDGQEILDADAIEGIHLENQMEVPVPADSNSVRVSDEFEKIKNPYAAYAGGGIVGDPDMFFGRDELIQNIAQAIQTSHLQSKCVLVFGQKRSGKSSVLYHLKALLQKDKNLLILNLDNIASIKGEHTRIPLMYQILRSILTELEYEIEDRVEEGFTPLEFSIPSDDEFYNHPNPLQCFGDTFKRLKRLVSKQEDWRGTRVVLLIDEFQYIYDGIVANEIPESFMQNWKALLQANYFSAVLVGQDVMQKF